MSKTETMSVRGRCPTCGASVDARVDQGPAETVPVIVLARHERLSSFVRRFHGRSEPQDPVYCDEASLSGRSATRAVQEWLRGQREYLPTVLKGSKRDVRKAQRELARAERQVQSVIEEQAAIARLTDAWGESS